MIKGERERRWAWRWASFSSRVAEGRILEVKSGKDFIDRELETGEEVTELSILGTDGIEAHFVNDAFEIDGVMGKESDAPFPVIEARGAGDELEDFAVPSAPDFGVTGHEFFALGEVEGIPILPWGAATFVHGVEAHHWPSWEDWIEAIFGIFFYALAKGDEFFGMFGGAEWELVFIDQGLGVVGFAGRVFASLGHGEETISGGEEIGAECEGEAFFEGAGFLQIGTEEHESEVSLGGEHGEGEDLRGLGGADFCDESTESGFGLNLLWKIEEGPESVFNFVEEMEDHPSFGRDKGIRIFFEHRIENVVGGGEGSTGKEC